MKQFRTIEEELMMITKNLSCLSSSEKDELSSGKSAGREAPLPGRHVIRNILNYSRSLEVLKKSSGSPLFLIKN